jgi:hypothetical protein
LRESLDGPVEEAESIGSQLATTLLEQGAAELLEQAAMAND